MKASGNQAPMLAFSSGDVSSNSKGMKGERLAPLNQKALGRWSSSAMAGDGKL
jgi:hypothetical protein